MRIVVEIVTTKQHSRASVSTEMRDGKLYEVGAWTAAGRCLTVRELDEVWTVLYDELDVQMTLLGG